MCPTYITSLVVITLVVIPAISANAIGCKLACKKCRDKVEHPSIVTVYCEMCDECKVKRDEQMKERMSLRSDPNSQVSQAIVEVDNLSDCPGPPPCEPEIVKLTKRPTTTTTTTTEPPPQPPLPRRCPPAPICVLRKTTQCPPPPPPPPLPPAPLYPCMQGVVPMCNFMQPMYQPQQQISAGQNQQTAPNPAPAANPEVTTPSIVRLPGDLTDPFSYQEVLVFQGVPAGPMYNYYMQPVYEMQPVYAYLPPPTITVLQYKAVPPSLAPKTTTKVASSTIKSTYSPPKPAIPVVRRQAEPHSLAPTTTKKVAPSTIKSTRSPLQPAIPVVRRQTKPPCLAPTTTKKVAPSTIKSTCSPLQPAIPVVRRQTKPPCLAPTTTKKMAPSTIKSTCSPLQPAIPVVRRQTKPPCLAPTTTTEVAPSTIKSIAADYQNSATPPSQQPNPDETTEYLSVYVGIPKALNLPDMDEEYDENVLGSALL